ncbi:unnamed protein product [Alternaria alternata]
MKGNRLVIGLDYGTTYTGVSFCESSSGLQGQHIEVIHDWPSQSSKNATQEKVPSEVAYREEGILWGALIPADTPRHMWTKLQLDANQVGEAAKIQREIATSSQNTSKQPDDVITDFLAQVKAHLLKNLDQKYGKTLWRTMPITLVVTVPATWSDLAKSRTLDAVDKAGFNTLEFPQPVTTILTTEPEAAAIYTIRTLRGTTQDAHFAVGDGFIVCDMGGGTVDLISYRVTGLNPTVIEEATVGCGDQCGGSSVDRAFLRWLEGRIGTADFVKIAGCRSEEVKYNSLEKRAATMLQNFTSGAKAGFSGTETYIMPLPFPLSRIEDDKSRGITDGEIQTTAEDMQGMFEKSIGHTYKLITQQHRLGTDAKNIKMKYIFMVGGFSESPYVNIKIGEFVENLKLIPIKPDYAWSSVARGAAAKGLEAEDPGAGVVKTRKCRRHYGTPVNSRFVEGQHMETDAYICEYTGVKRARCQASWLLIKGQDLATTTKAPHAMLHLHRGFWLTEKRITKVSLIASNSDEAPRRSTEEDVFRVAKLTINLTKVPKRTFKVKRSPDGRTYHEIDFEVEISIQSALEYSCSVKGKRVGSVTVEYK